jgi:hypothetical protein
MRTFIFFLFIAFLPLYLVATEPYKAAREYQIKAAFLYNFANFITWPANAFESVEEHFKICVLGKNPFADMLGVTIENVTAKGRHLNVIFLQNNLEGILECHLLYVHPDMNPQMDNIRAIIGDRPILSVGEEKDFIAQGGIIGFFSENKKMRLAISLQRLDALKLKADANLLRLSLLCKPEGCDE